MSTANETYELTQVTRGLCRPRVEQKKPRVYGITMISVTPNYVCVESRLWVTEPLV